MVKVTPRLNPFLPRCWHKSCEKTRWAHSVALLYLCYCWRFLWTPALHLCHPANPRGKLSSPLHECWQPNAAMSCQTELALSFLYRAHWEAAWATNTSPIRPINTVYLKNSIFNCCSQPGRIELIRSSKHEPRESHQPSVWTTVLLIITFVISSRYNETVSI